MRRGAEGEAGLTALGAGVAHRLAAAGAVVLLLWLAIFWAMGS